MMDIEIKAMKISAELWNCLSELPFNHPDDMPDLKFHIHAIQNIVLARVGQRVYNEKIGKELVTCKMEFPKELIDVTYNQ